MSQHTPPVKQQIPPAEAKSLSVFFPAFNEEENIEKTVSDAVLVLKKLDLEWEILVINDGSRDKTEEVVEKLAKQNPRIRLVDHGTNKGYGFALKTGFKESKYPWVVFADSDGQFDFSEITKFLEKTDESDFILGYRLNRADPLIRKVLTWGWKTLARVMFGLKVRDYSCGFKLIKRESFNSLLPLEAEEKVTQIEFLVKAMKKGYKFAEVGVRHYHRVYGKPTGAKLTVVFKSFLDLIKLWWKINVA